jgi:hypothetical protein
MPLFKRQIFIIGTITYFALAVIAGVYYKERTAFLDVSFRLFHLLDDGTLNIQANRFGEMLTQWIPLLGRYLQLPIAWIAWGYSIGLVLYYYTLFFICVRGLHRADFGLLLLLFNVFMVSYTFWWMQIEFAQGIALAIVFFAWLSKSGSIQRFSIPSLLLYLVWVRTLIYFHPLLPLVLLLGLTFLIFKPQTAHVPTLKTPLYSMTSLWILIEVWMKNNLFPKAWYDAQASEGLKNFELLFPNYWDIPANQNFIRYCWTDYYLLPMALVLITFFYVWKRQFFKLFFVWIAFFGYLLLVNVSNYQGMPQFHIESFYLPLSLIVLFPLVFDLFPSLRYPKLAILLIVAVLVLRVVHIAQLHRPYTARVAWQESVLERTSHLPNQKIILAEKDVPMDTLIQSWGSAFEFWLLSSIQNHNNPRSVVIYNDWNKFDYALPQNKVFLSEWEVTPYEELPKKYFNFQDTSYYVKIKLDTLAR